MRARRSPVTLEDVAKASGYSRATVSRVVNNHETVDPIIKAAVERAISRLGYVSNPSARALAGGSSMTIGLVFMESFRDLFQNAFWGEVVEGIHRVLAQANYQPAFLVRDQVETGRVESSLLHRHIDGVILMSTALHDTWVVKLAERGYPVVMFGTPEGHAAISAASVDEVAVGAIAARHLLKVGRGLPVAITGRSDMQESEMRLRGFRDTMAAAGVPVPDDAVRHGDYTEIGGADAMHELLQRNPDTDSVFALSDRMAIGALNTLKANGRKIPDDVSLIGVDGTAMGESTRPTLTSVGSDLGAIGEELALLTLGAIRGETARRISFAPHLIERGSA